jgi:hypothetical protein
MIIKTMYNFLILINTIKDITLYKICLNKNIDQIFIEYLNKYKIWNNLKEIEISISNINLFIDLKIICPKINELKCFIDINFKYNNKEIMNIFPNIKILNIFIQNKFDLNNFMNDLKDTKIQNLYINCEYEEEIKLTSKIILNNIKNLRIDIYQNNNLLSNIFNYINFRNLESYEINYNLNELIKINIEHNENNDYNYVNIFLIDILNNKEQFIFNKFIYLP